MIEFDSEMVIRFQDMRSPISYFSRVYGFNGYLNFYRKGGGIQSVVTYLREGKAMDELRKAMRDRGYNFIDRKAGISIEVEKECYVCEMIDSLLSVKNALIDVPIFVSDGDVILRIKFFKSSSELQRIIFKDSEKRDFFSINYLGPVRSDKDWLLENEKGWEMKKLVFYVVPTKSRSEERRFLRSRKGIPRVGEDAQKRGEGARSGYQERIWNKDSPRGDTGAGDTYRSLQTF
jgi:hypothetical protein